MSRVTLLDGSFWVSLSAPCGANGTAKAEAGYPPYNVELLEGEPEALRITLAVAGFAPDQLEVSTENGELSIRGKQNEEQPRDFLHRGIAARQFQRSFRLASGGRGSQGGASKRPAYRRALPPARGEAGDDNWSRRRLIETFAT